MSRPLLLNLTTNCNARCEFCSVLDTLNRPDMNMSDEQVFETIRAARAEGATEIGYTGGEPSVHPRFVEIIEFAREAGFTHQSMNTNGIKFRKPAFCRRVVEAGMKSIDFSVHGHTDEIHDDLVGCRGALAAIREAAGHLRELQKTHRFHLSATTVVTSSNHTRLRPIVEMLDELGFDNKRIKHAYEGILRIEAVRRQIAPYEDVMPSLESALDFLVTRPFGFQVTHFPLCLLREYAVFSTDFERRDAKMVFRDETFQGDASQKARSDSNDCSQCVLANVCTRVDAAYESWHSRPALTPFVSHRSVDEMFDRAAEKFPSCADRIGRTRALHEAHRDATRVDFRPDDHESA